MKLPFNLTLASFLLKGNQKELARINYEFSGYEREIKEANLLWKNSPDLNKRLLDIDFQYGKIDEYEYQVSQLKENHQGKELQRELLDIERQFEKITKEEYDYKLVEILYDGDERTEARLALDHKYGKLTQNEYEKAIASHRNQPWCSVINSEFNPDNPVHGLSLELDWNDAFIQSLVQAGYNGTTDEQIVEQWFDQIAQQELQEELESSLPSNVYTGNQNKTVDK